MIDYMLMIDINFNSRAIIYIYSLILHHFIYYNHFYAFLALVNPPFDYYCIF